jgi:glycosyltransferase involved in cell wall biosynthesis
MAAHMKILFLTRKWPPAVGGMEVYASELVRELKTRAELDLRALPGRSGGKRPSAVAMIVFGLSTALDLLLNGTGADAAHGGDLAMWPLVFIARLRRSGIRAVLSAHGSDVALCFRRGFRAKLYALYLKLGVLLLPSVVVLANSRATARLCAQCGFANVRAVPLATHLAEDETQEPEPYILFVGRLMRRKGCAWFIREVLPSLDPAVRLVVAGVVWDADERCALDHPAVEFRGPVFGHELAQLRARATAVIVPNLEMGMDGFEGFGLTAVEGAADGGVVLAAEVDGVADAVRHGKTGFLLPAGDAGCWAAKIAEISTWTHEERRTFIEGSREAIAQIYSWSRVAEETLDAYRQVAEQPLAAAAVSES